MSALWTAAELAAATGGRASADFAVTGVAFDSREVGTGDLFVALTGEVTDGHHYVDSAFARGAAGAIVAQPVAHPHVLVDDTARALDDLGRAARARSGATIVAVTGSVGKTGTKEALFAALDRVARGGAHRSVKSYNNHVGVPLSLARMPRDARYGVFEMGMNHAGELAHLTRIVRPHIAIVTAIAPAHIEFFDSIEGIARAKAEIFEGLEPGGTAIIPADSEHVGILRAAAERHATQIVSFGFAADADVRALDHVDAPDGGSIVTARLGQATLCYTIAAPGRHWIANSLAVVAAVHAAGADPAVAALALAELPGLPGRGARHRVPWRDGDLLVIDESYNANPVSMAATLADLGRVRGRRHVAVLGAMRELGADSDAFHAALVPHLARAEVATVMLVGEAMAPLAAALAAGEGGDCTVIHFPDAAAACAQLDAWLQPGDAVLVKGSNATGLSAIVAALVKDDV